ncbi:DUF3179 domain-containing protein [Pontibacter locisalis]|uniref:DUF3179 domain-containing protein n=1 Tax=Pontibacter locisalis TaxID=1719035 RepID=A0ABW5IQ90_9BACT
MRYLVLSVLVLLLTGCNAQNNAQNKVKNDSQEVRVLNGFEIIDPTVLIGEIYEGTPNRDNIPAISNPEYVTAANADFMNPSDEVIGISINQDVKAYPIKILTWHEIVNDVVGGKPVVISYCPLCNSAYVFSREINDSLLTFGVSGLLYNSNVVMYDHQTESLWSQVKAEAISGKMKGAELPQVAATSTTWEGWLSQHPDTEVLSTNTGYNRDYNRSPYGDYTGSKEIMFPVQETSDRYHPKTLVAGIEIDGAYKAYPFPELRKAASDTVKDTYKGQELSIRFDEKANSVTVKQENGEKVIVNQMYWFAWYAFHPETAVFEANK